MARRTQEVHEFQWEKIAVFPGLRLQFITFCSYECKPQSKGTLTVTAVSVISSNFHIIYSCWGFFKIIIYTHLSKIVGFPGGSDGKESTCSAGNLGSIRGLGRSPGGGHGNPFQYSCLENPHGQRSLAGCSPWDHKEWDTAERLSTHAHGPWRNVR